MSHEPNVAIVNVTRQELRVLVNKTIVQKATSHGAPGPRGPINKGFNFVQSVAATVWTIAHNLDYKPAVTTLSVGGMEMVGDVLHLSNNVLTVSFNIAVAGTARLT